MMKKSIKKIDKTSFSVMKIWLEKIDENFFMMKHW